MREIPLFDARACGTVGYAVQRAEAARSLCDECCFGAPAWMQSALRPIDLLSARWLGRTPSPYVPEMREIAARLGFPGIVTINMGFQFACTTGIAPGLSEPPLMRRVLDWVCPGLGERVEVVRQRGQAGEYYNVTWPGAVGVLTAMAPGRFCAAINQAPLYRRTRSRALIPIDMALNLGRTMSKEHGWPPDHLLRHAFDTCADFRSAVDLLSCEPLARPALFSLAGAGANEAVLIERKEREATLYWGASSVANAWREPQEGWTPRAWLGVDPIESNRARVALMRRANVDGQRGFEWLARPVLNATTRVAVEMSARDGDLLVIGYESNWKEKTAFPVTHPFDLSRETLAPLV